MFSLFTSHYTRGVEAKVELKSNWYNHLRIKVKLKNNILIHEFLIGDGLKAKKRDTYQLGSQFATLEANFVTIYCNT